MKNIFKIACLLTAFCSTQISMSMTSRNVRLCKNLFKGSHKFINFVSSVELGVGATLATAGLGVLSKQYIEGGEANFADDKGMKNMGKMFGGLGLIGAGGFLGVAGLKTRIIGYGIKKASPFIFRKIAKRLHTRPWQKKSR